MPKIPISEAWWLSPLDRAELMRRGVSEVDALTEYKVDAGAGSRVSWGQPAGITRAAAEAKTLEVTRVQSAKTGFRSAPTKGAKQPK